MQALGNLGDWIVSCIEAFMMVVTSVQVVQFYLKFFWQILSFNNISKVKCDDRVGNEIAAYHV